MKLKLIISFLLALPMVASCAAFAPPNCPGNLEPMYGEMEKSPECKAVDAKFIRAALKLGTSERGSVEMARLGFKYLSKGDMDTAMKRFNQAWLLNYQNCEIYSGFAIIKHQRDHDTAAAERLFKTGARMCPLDGALKSNYGRFLEETGQLERAVSMLEESIKLNPTIRASYTGLVLAHAKLGNEEKCLDAIRRGKRYGLIVDPKLLEELEYRVREKQ